MPSRRVHRLLPVLVLALAFAACSARNATPAPQPTAPPVVDAAAVAALQHAQASIAEGFTMDVRVANFVLPQWGGSDGGTVQTGPGGATARAQLRRTGEDSSYTILLAGGATYFKRGTCEIYARIPGGGANVLSPFLLNASDALAKAANAHFATSARTVIAANVAGLGDALITIDASGRVTSIEFGDQPNNQGSTGFSFIFTHWGGGLSVDKPAGVIADRGPGGNPC